LFAEQLFRKGGVLKYFQVAITDFIPFWLIYSVFIGVILVISFRKKRVWVGLVLVLICFLMVFKFDERPLKRSEVQTRPNVLIIATDSLRPQSISYNGYPRKTPHIDRLFSQGANFLNAKASMARTLQAWTTILTSTYPPEHGIRHMFPVTKVLDKKWNTAVSILNKNGYYTAVISDFAGDIFPSIDFGFQDIVSPSLSVQSVLKQRSLEIHYFLMGFLLNPLGWDIFPEMWGMTLNKEPWHVVQSTKKAIKKAIKQNKPFFLVYFSSNNHFPYSTTYPYYRLYTPRGYNGKHKYGLSNDVLESFLEKGASDEDVPQLYNLYDNATKLFDDNVGELAAFLKRCSVDKNTIVIIMSDHGENLHENGYGLAHGDHLSGPYSNNMVLGFYSPFENFKGLRVENTVRDIDIAPTVLDLLKVSIPSSFRGHSLVPVMQGQPFQGYPAYMESGIWYSPRTPYIKNRIRIPYPTFTDLMEVEMPGGRIVLKAKYENTVIAAKYKALQLNEKKYIYMPGEHEYREEFYVNEKRIDKRDITDIEFLFFKEKIVEMFKDKFYIDEKGFIREYILDKSSPK